MGQLASQLSLPLAAEQVVQVIIAPIYSPAEQAIKPTLKGESAQAAGQKQEEGQGFGNPVSSKHSNDPLTAYIRSINIHIANSMMPKVLHLVEVMV